MQQRVATVAIEIPQYLTHYYYERPFHSITMLDADERIRVLAEIATRRELKRRLRSEFYFEQRLRYELVMHEQFLAKGGRPQLERPHYAVLGESEIWTGLVPNSIRIPLSTFSSDCISFTYTDSWAVYVDRTMQNHFIRRKPQYEMVYRLEELPDLFEQYGWPGDRWKTETEWEHDVYVEVQIWNDGPLADHLPN